MDEMPRRILIIDDSDDLREGLAIRLKAEGYEVGSFGTGEGGLKAMAEQPFDLVLLDMVMPGKDGIETYQALRAAPATCHTPVILMTAMAVENHWEALPYDTDGPCYVTGKPSDMAMLVARITQLLAEVRGPN